QCVALEHHVDRPAVRRHASEIGAVEQHATLLRRLKPCEQSQQGGLAAPGRSEQSKEFTLENVERQPIDADHGTETLADAVKPDQRPRGRIGPWRKDSARALADSRQVGIGVGTRHAGTLTAGRGLLNRSVHGTQWAWRSGHAGQYTGRPSGNAGSASCNESGNSRRGSGP